MGALYSGVSITGYNANPPDDDGSQTEANRVKWETIKEKITDPTKVRTDSMDTALQESFGKIDAGVTSTAISYDVIESDQGKLVRATASGVTIKTPDATDVGAPFVFDLVNNSDGDITLDGFDTQTVDGEDEITIPAGCGLRIRTNGSNWFTSGQNFPTPVVYPPAGLFTSLVIKVTGNTGLTVAASGFVVSNGTKSKVVAVSSAVNMGTTGIDALIGGSGGSGADGTITAAKWYHAWAISKEDGTTKVVMATSSTADSTFLAALANIDSGSYTYYARMGAVRTAAGVAQLMGTWQFGNRVQYKVGLAQTALLPNIANGVAGTHSTTAPTYAAASVVDFVPPTASEISIIGTVVWQALSTAALYAAPNASYSGRSSASGNIPPLSLDGAAPWQLAVTFVLESTSVYWASNAAGGAISCMGWTDNL